MGVCVLLGSKSDLEKAQGAFEIFRQFDVDFDVHIASAHRTPEMVKNIVQNSKHDAFLVFAGLSAALPGAVAALTTKPVIGVPLSGRVPFDSLLSMVQMPKGVPVAVVGVDNVINGALMCIQILAIKDERLERKILEYRERMREKVAKDDEEVRRYVQS
ncbi:5-(carboxyamino)imidazole ribonucleotide mutase [Candidatus Aciduliprofundum boonei]|uniref:N5-carboxyaminoimidazole ribonucleotide mutase n=1 Tax=Aciduliprofundum boonei (strain DSM 19572 / T469) TaxID=439481 RepID=B5IA66_ACIB4|nr:5-(carboxyamino)imidazole ribonucleotide mutase [Candidatus Aciduliprofundum boonei]ADD08298.1 phosphoribosylaminoimidazole carboxylase, catalytic subunit [Aciduliprofundum boonei T469]EDY36671.1 phosphoribosylaminoimidazole carboxylase, catalytic subunit [Aciduliprofundum boonei T469]HII54645.1 5-(carboxyamino)imidazole ribonucleotide mutase [Candidatus Aciduliprofundum boonei]